MKSTIFSVGIIEIKWYSFLLLLAFAIGFFIIVNQRKKVNLDKQEITDFLFYLIIICILGARIYYCLFNLNYYLKYPLDILKIWEGGLAIHGGIIFGVLYLYLYSHIKKISILKLTDIIVPSLALGQAIGRWGNFFNQEAYGPITTYNNLHSLHIPNCIIEGMHINSHYYHPTFLYESIWCLIIFIILMLISIFKNNKIGIITSTYLIMYGIERFFIEELRQDSLMFFNMKIAQFVSLIMIVIGIVILVFIRKKNLSDK